VEPDSTDQTARHDSIPAAIEQIRRTVEQNLPLPDPGTASPAGAPTLGKRPAPLAPPPGANGRSFGVLQWSGTKGDRIEIDGANASAGSLTGDALPGVPVSISIENENGSIVQLPSEADGFRKLILHPGAGRIRIHWKTLGTGQGR
jgi:hypothetical protein